MITGNVRLVYLKDPRTPGWGTGLVLQDRRDAWDVFANPEMIPGGLCLYVGLTGLSPQKRFHNHRRGHKAARIVRRHGRRLLPAFYRQYNPVPFEVGKVLEPWLAARLRERRFGVWQN
jgi:hypothetical protein